MEYDKKYAFLLEKLESSGFKAYLVGGCVRDMLLGRTVGDFDITTDALPKQVTEVFSDLKVIPTGIKHGTVTVIYDSTPFEITTFRVDGDYSDSRRPDSVSFTPSLEKDLARRDFTVNAMAMDKNGNITDLFGGLDNLKSRTIKCVGDPVKRFSEDALRILRAVRFSSVLGFEIDTATAEAALAMRENLNDISRERCRDELEKMIMGEDFTAAALKYRDIIAQIVPELRPSFDFDQHSRYHKYDVYEHTVRAVSAAPFNRIVRTAMLFHDIGKPSMFTLDENGVGHFKGHAGVSAEIAEKVMKRLHCDNDTISQVCTIIAHHSDEIVSEKQVKRLISKIGAETFFLLMEAKKADNLAKRDFVLEENEVFDSLAETARQLIQADDCMSLKQLAVNGNDITALGVNGKAVGECLGKLLELVVDGALPNEKSALIGYVKENLI